MSKFVISLSFSSEEAVNVVEGEFLEGFRVGFIVEAGVLVLAIVSVKYIIDQLVREVFRDIDNLVHLALFSSINWASKLSRCNSLPFQLIRPIS